MEWNKILYTSFLLVSLLLNCNQVNSQDAAFELPVQLVGFPVIILSVRLTNFLKKLSYSLSPATYRSRNRRQLSYDAEPFDVTEVEKYIVSEFGARACVFERVCAHYAARAKVLPKPPMDWPDVFSQYKRSSDQAKDFYLLSVFLGDIVGSPQLCHHLGKRRSCDEDLLQGVTDSPLCRACMTEETAAHVVLNCTEVVQYRAKHLGSLRCLPDAITDIKGLVGFLEELGWLDLGKIRH